MKKRKFIINILIIFLLSGCQQIVSNEEYINLSAMLKENKDKLELADSYVDYSEYGIENNDQNNFEMEVGNIASLGLLYFRFKKIGNSNFNFRQVSYIQMPDMFYVHAYELKSNKAAINAYNKICNENVESVYDRLKVKNNNYHAQNSEK